MQKTQILPQRNTPSHKLARKYSHYNISFLYFLPRPCYSPFLLLDGISLLFVDIAYHRDQQGLEPLLPLVVLFFFLMGYGHFSHLNNYHPPKLQNEFRKNEYLSEQKTLLKPINLHPILFFS